MELNVSSCITEQDGKIFVDTDMLLEMIAKKRNSKFPFIVEEAENDTRQVITFCPISPTLLEEVRKLATEHKIDCFKSNNFAMMGFNNFDYREFVDSFEFTDEKARKKVSLEFYLEFQEWIDDETFVEEHKQLFTEDNIRKYATQLNWHLLCSTIPMTESFMEEFIDRLEWHNICMYQKLSENFMRKHKDKMEMGQVTVHQKLSLSFLKEFKDDIWWSVIDDAMYSKFSFKFMEEMEDHIDWDKLTRKKKNITIKMIERFKENLDLKKIAISKEMSDEFLMKNFRKMGPKRVLEARSSTKLLEHIYPRAKGYNYHDILLNTQVSEEWVTENISTLKDDEVDAIFHNNTLSEDCIKSIIDCLSRNNISHLLNTHLFDEEFLDDDELLEIVEHRQCWADLCGQPLLGLKTIERFFKQDLCWESILYSNANLTEKFLWKHRKEFAEACMYHRDVGKMDRKAYKNLSKEFIAKFKNYLKERNG